MQKLQAKNIKLNIYRIENTLSKMREVLRGLAGYGNSAKEDRAKNTQRPIYGQRKNIASQRGVDARGNNSRHVLCNTWSRL
jgi:hypothetical protein